MILFFIFVEYVERYNFLNRFAGLHVNEWRIISYAFHMIKTRFHFSIENEVLMNSLL